MLQHADTDGVERAILGIHRELDRVEAQLDELGRKLVEKGIVSSKRWHDARKGRAQLDSILAHLENAPRNKEDTGPVDASPVLTTYQAEKIRDGREADLRLDHFVVLSRLGDGGMGEVLRCWNTYMHREEAVKRLRIVENKEARKRFELEVQALAKLKHTRLPGIYSFNPKSTPPYFSMEYIRGRDLQIVVQEAIKAASLILIQTAVKWTIAVAEVLAYTHEAGVIHRDVKPANIMKEEAGGLKLLDLGLARLALGNERLTMEIPNQVLGTPAFMSPEQYAAPASVGPTSDIYSLGCCLYYFLAGKHPFSDLPARQLPQAHREHKPLSLSTHRNDVPIGLDMIVLSTLAKSPKDRPQTCDDLIRRLREFGEPNREPPLPDILSLRDWPTGFDVRSAVVGDRRESPPHTSADVLVRPASMGDLYYFCDLAIRPRIRSDKIIQIATDEALRRELKGDLLVISSPAANMVARVVNRGAFFRFVCTDRVKEDVERFELELKPIKFRRQQLEEFLDEKRSRQLNIMLNLLAQAGFVDPIDFTGLRGAVRKGSNDFGVVTLCRNPWDDNGVAILAAGVGGPATAAALKLLSRPKAFDRHPLGGVFKVQISQEAPWEERYDMLYPMWDTHEYDLQTYLDAVKNLSEKVKRGEVREGEGLREEDASDLRALVDLLRKRRSEESSCDGGDAITQPEIQNMAPSPGADEPGVREHTKKHESREADRGSKNLSSHESTASKPARKRVRRKRSHRR